MSGESGQGGGYVAHGRLPDFDLWERMAAERRPANFEIELTARCNNDCRHCYINLPAGDAAARAAEPSLAEIERWADEAVDLGSVWCLVTGGEPLLRDDFEDVYMALKRRGLLIGLFTNACLVTERHVELLRRYPPRDLEVTVYGATAKTYDAVAQRPGAHAAFVRGLDRLLDAGLPLRLKAMALRSNAHELAEMGEFCRRHTKDYYRFDPLLHLRYDGDAARNALIRAERLTPREIVDVERADAERFGALRARCLRLGDRAAAEPEGTAAGEASVFSCGAGRLTLTIGADGRFRLCSALTDRRYTYDLRAGSLTEAWTEFAPRVLALRSRRPEFVARCAGCEILICVSGVRRTQHSKSVNSISPWRSSARSDTHGALPHGRVDR